MQALHQLMRRKPHRQDHLDGHMHGANDLGSRLMLFMGRLSPFTGIDTMLSDYRSGQHALASHGALVGSAGVLIAGIMLWLFLPPSLAWIGAVLSILPGLYLLGVIGGGMAIMGFVQHVRGSIRQTIIRSIHWTGREQVLDVGCGTGLLVNGCAAQLTTGSAIGIDLWQEAVGGTPDTLMVNAQAEGVAGRVKYREMDARQLDFADGSFDAVVSSVALHHIGGSREEVSEAVGEMIRVLAPGGTISLADIAPMIAIAETVIVEAGLSVSLREQTPVMHFITARKAEG